MAIELFGYRIGKAEEDKKLTSSIPSFAPPPNDDGSYEVAPGGSYGTYVDLEASAKNEGDLVSKYRDLALQPEVESAIDDIVNEAIIREDNKSSVEINLDKTEQSDRVKDRIREEFKEVLKLFDFQNMSYDMFRRWYIDGRLYYHMMIDEKNPRKGLQEIRYIDPRRIRKVREEIKKSPANNSRPNSDIAPLYNEYYMYSQKGPTNFSAKNVKISKDSIAYVQSGIMDKDNKLVLSHLHKAIKVMNQLRMLEDATVIYRMSRAPERRIFYIDVGNLPKIKAEQYIRDMMVKHKNRLVYNATTGEIQDSRKFMTMLEDFWLPRREGGRGTEITTLPGGQNLGQMEDVEYFRQKVYKSLNVPISRLQSDTNFSFGRTGEISRDEIKFSRMIDRLRQRFTHLFDITLETQLLLRGVMSRAEWKEIKENVHYDFLRDNYFAELKDQEVLTARLNILQVMDPFVGKYFSTQYIREKILRMTEDEIKTTDKEMAVDTKELQDQMQQAQSAESSPAAAPQQTPIAAAKQEQKEMSSEEKLLVENMTRALDNVTLQGVEDDL